MKSPKLTEKEKKTWVDVCELFFYDKLTNREISKLVGIHETTVGEILKRVMFYKVLNPVTVDDIEVITKKSNV